MSSRNIFLCGVLFWAQQISSPTAAAVKTPSSSRQQQQHWKWIDSLVDSLKQTTAVTTNNRNTAASLRELEQRLIYVSSLIESVDPPASQTKDTAASLRELEQKLVYISSMIGALVGPQKQTINRKVCYYTNSLSFASDCTWLEFYNAELTSLDLSNSTFTGLAGISLGFNKLTEMPHLSTSTKATLQQLWLTYNKIASVPADYFSDFRSLTELIFSFNKLTEMPRMPASVTQMKKFIVYENKISAIPAGYFSGFSELVALWISGNKIQRFHPRTFFAHLSKLEELYVDQMDCDCATLRVWQQIAAMANIPSVWIYKNGVEMRDFPCAGDLSNTTLQELRSKNCTPPSNTAPPSVTAPPPIEGKIKAIIFAIGVLAILT